MPWTYLKADADGDLLSDSPRLPGPSTAYLAYDLLRAAVVIGYTERGGYSSFLGPNVDDDCVIAAYAPLSETSDPDVDKIKANWPSWDGEPSYGGPCSVVLFREYV